MERAQAALVLAQKTFDRTRTLTEQGNAPQARLDQVTSTRCTKANARSIRPNRPMNRRSTATRRKSGQIAKANVEKANADIQSVQSIIDQLVVYAPVASQIYQRNVEPGEYVSPGVPLVTLIDLADRLDPLRPSRGSRQEPEGRRPASTFTFPLSMTASCTVEVKLIATKGEYASWRATRSHGRFRSAHVLHPRLSRSSRCPSRGRE